MLSLMHRWYSVWGAVLMALACGLCAPQAVARTVLDLDASMLPKSLKAAGHEPETIVPNT